MKHYDLILLLVRFQGTASLRYDSHFEMRLGNPTHSGTFATKHLHFQGK